MADRAFTFRHTETVTTEELYGVLRKYIPFKREHGTILELGVAFEKIEEAEDWLLDYQNKHEPVDLETYACNLGILFRDEIKD
jgi:hypothetical protein